MAEKYIMTLDEINSAWKIDSVVDRNDIATESIKVPSLHAKYLELLSAYKLKLRKIYNEYNAMKSLRQRYYTGKLTKEELLQKNWDQYQENKPLKTEMNEILNSDKELSKFYDKVVYMETVIYTLESIMKSLHSRSYDIKNYIAWQTLTMGG